MTKFIVQNNKIRFGLGSIKNVGIAVVEDIVKEKNENGKFKSFTDFCERMSKLTINRKCVESFIKAGAFDEFGKTRATLLASFETILDSINSSSRNKMENQVSMFDLFTENSDGEASIKYNYTELPELDVKEYLSMEKEMLGIYLSGHPLEKFKNKIEQLTNINCLNLLEIDTEMQETGSCREYKDGQNVKIAGIISKVKKKITKNNSLMAFVTVDDLYGSFETIVFESIFNKCGYAIEEEKIVLIEGRLSIKEEESAKIIASNIKEMMNQDDEIKYINVNITSFSEEKKEKLRNVIRQYSKMKNANILIDVTVNGEIRKCGKIYLDMKLLQNFYDYFGKENIVVQ